MMMGNDGALSGNLETGQLIGVTTANRICWLRASSTEMREWAVSVTIPVPSAS